MTKYLVSTIDCPTICMYKPTIGMVCIFTYNYVRIIEQLVHMYKIIQQFAYNLYRQHQIIPRISFMMRGLLPTARGNSSTREVVISV